MSRMVTVMAMVGVMMLAGQGVQTAAAQSAPEARVRFRAADPVSGAEVTVYRAGPDGAAFQVADKGVSVRKSVSGRTTETSIETSTRKLMIWLGPDGVRLDGTDGPLVVVPGNREAAGQLTGRLAQSGLVREALDLLQRVSHQASSPIAHALVATRVMLMTLSGEVESARALGRSLTGGEQARLVRAWTLQSPGDCWDQYAQEAIEAYLEYEDCVENEQWWDVAGLAICLGIYEMRAIGAFSWWLSCVSIRS